MKGSSRVITAALGAMAFAAVLGAAAHAAWRLETSMRDQDQTTVEALRMRADGARDDHALAALRRQAVGGVPFAQRALGSVLWARARAGGRDGSIGQEAAHWLSAAAEQGDAVARRELASAYRSGGPGLAQDLPRARQLFDRAANQGDAVAAHQLGLMLHAGDGGAVDLQQARERWLQAAAAGEADAMYRLGNLYAYGEGVTASPGTAIDWYERAATLEHPQALQELAMIYREGRLGQTPNAQRANEAMLELQHALQHHRD